MHNSYVVSPTGFSKMKDCWIAISGVALSSQNFQVTHVSRLTLVLSTTLNIFTKFFTYTSQTNRVSTLALEESKCHKTEVFYPNWLSWVLFQEVFDIVLERTRAHNMVNHWSVTTHQKHSTIITGKLFWTSVIVYLSKSHAVTCELWRYYVLSRFAHGTSGHSRKCDTERAPTNQPASKLRCKAAKTMAKTNKMLVVFKSSELTHTHPTTRTPTMSTGSGAIQLWSSQQKLFRRMNT